MKGTPFSLFALILFLLLPFVLWAQQPTFAIVSDSHVGYRNSSYPAFIQAIEKERIEVIIHTGDAIDSPGNTDQWKRFLEITGPGKTLHLAPGNHDIHGEASLQVFLTFFPEPYHSFAQGDTLFVLLCTELPGQEARITGEQFAWARTELQRPFRYKFVFLHEPPFPAMRGHGLDRYVEMRDRLHRLFLENKVSLVVAGHDHLYDRKTRDGIAYIIAGRTGGWSFPEGLSYGDALCYTAATETKDGYSFTVRGKDGEAKDRFSIERVPARPQELR